VRIKRMDQAKQDASGCTGSPMSSPDQASVW
jgi:hypothetical protein